MMNKRRAIQALVFGSGMTVGAALAAVVGLLPMGVPIIIALTTVIVAGGLYRADMNDTWGD